MTLDAVSKNCPDLAVPVSARDHIQGSVSAPVTLVEYGDYECPDCLNAWPVVQELQRALGDRLAFVFRHFPMSSVHPHASYAAQAAEAAASQGKFWEMHDQLFANQKELTSLDLTHLALTMGMEVYRFETALEADGNLRRIREDSLSATESGVKGTPTFFINGCRYRGKIDATSLLAEIQSQFMKL
jgi:protein-disulfide isomerase